MSIEEIKQEAHKMMLFAISNQADIEPVMNQLDIAIDKATAQERASWINQPANEHDERIRLVERERIIERIRNHKHLSSSDKINFICIIDRKDINPTN